MNNLLSNKVHNIILSKNRTKSTEITLNDNMHKKNLNKKCIGLEGKKRSLNDNVQRPDHRPKKYLKACIKWKALGNVCLATTEIAARAEVYLPCHTMTCYVPK